MYLNRYSLIRVPINEILLYMHSIGEQLLLGLAHFSNALYTLSEKTIEDTNLTVRQYESARVLYDACRGELEVAELAQTQGKNVPAAKLDFLQTELEKSRDKFEKLKHDVIVKAKLLEENRVSGLFVCLFVCLFVYLFVCLFVCLFVYLYMIYLSL